MTVNGQYSDPPFGMPAAVTSTGAPGSAGAMAHPAQADTALHSQVTGVYESVQNRPVPMAGAGADDTAMPGQLYEGISGLGPADTADTGAGKGSTGHAPHPASGQS
jgi:hypothetical protein